MAGFATVVRSTALVLLAGGLVGAGEAPPEGAAVVEGRPLANKDGSGVWLGVVGTEPENHSWTFRSMCFAAKLVRTSVVFVIVLKSLVGQNP